MNEDNDVDNNDDINIANTSTSPSPDTITNIPSSSPLDTPITLTELQHQPQNGFIDTFNPLKLRANPQQDVQPSSFTQSQLTSSNLTQKFHSQLKLIDERSESTRLEHEAQLKQLQAIESTLPLDQRLTHSNREIKKNAYKDLTEMCLINFDSSSDKNEFIETFSPWIKYCIEETNAYVLAEALNFFITFNTVFPEQNENCIKDFIDNFERIVSYGVASINECCRRVVFMFIKERKSFSNVLNMLMRCLNNNSIKLLKFVIDVYAELIDERMVNDVYLKGVFEKFIRLNDGIVGNNKYSEKRKLYVKIISLIYEHIEDDVSVVKKHNKINSIKEIEGILKKIKKVKGKTLYRLYPNDISSAEGTDVQTVHEHNTQQDVYDSHGNNNNSGGGDRVQNTISNSNNNDSNVPPEEVSDILVVFPDCFYEYHFKTNFQEKLNILEDTNKRFQHVKHIKPSNTNTSNISNYNDIYKITNISIDDSNILIHFEGIKLLKHLCRLLTSNIHQHKLKLLLESSFHKFNNKKSLIKNELFSLFDTIIEHNCFPSCDVFISFALSFCTTNKKITAIVKQNILEYLKLLLKRKVHIIHDKHLLSFSKSVVDVILNEASSTVKDVCSDLLVVIKGKIKDAKAFEKVVKELPSYRKKVIEEGNDNLNGHVVVSEGNYKRNLRKVKSSLSVNRRERSVNKSFKGDGDSGSKSKRKDSRLSAVSTPKKNEKKFKGKKMGGDNCDDDDRLGVGRKKEVVNNIKQIKHVGDTGDNEIDSSLYNNNNNNNDNDTHMNENTQMNMNDNDNDDDNGDDNNEVLTKEVKLHTNNNNNGSNIVVNTNHNNNNNNNNDSHLQTSLSQSINERKDTLEQEISQFTLKQINEYSSSVTTDFLSFVNTITLSSTSENLYTHFQIIFSILSKLIDRIQVLVLTDTSVLLSLIKRILRVVILAPCINDIEYCTPIESSELEAFLSKVKKAYGNNDAFYAMMLEYLLYFSKKDEKTFKSMNSKTAVDYYLKYIYNEYYKYEKGRQVKEAFIKFIEMTEVLDESEKEEYVKMYLGEEYARNNGDVSLRIDISNIEHVQEQSVITTMNNNNNNVNNVNSGNKGGNDGEGNDEFLVNKIKESQKLIDEKKKENEQLREKIKLIEQRRKAHMNKLNIADNNNSSNNTNDNTITNMNMNTNVNDTDELTPHKGKLTIINDKAIPTTTITTTTTNNAKDDMSDLHKIIEDNKERIIRNIKKIESAQHEHNNFNMHTNTNNTNTNINTTPPSQLLNTSNITNTSIINNSKSSSSESILKIKEQLNNTTKKLGIALQRMVQQTEPKDDIQLQLQQQQTQTLLQQQQQQILAQNQMIEQMQKQLQMPLPTTTPPAIQLQPQPQQMLYTQQFIPIQPQQILTSYTLPFTPQQPQQTQFILQSQPLQSVNVIPQQQQQQPQYTYQSLISSLINNFQTLTPIDTSLYSSLTLAYRKLPSSQAKLTFISTLRNALDNHKTLLSQIPLNMFLTLYDFLLNLLSSEIILQQKDETVIIRLQELSEYLKQFKDLTNMFKLMMFLLRKYMPRNLNSKVSEHALVMIKVITYLLKELLKTFHEGKVAEAKEVIAEINELFLVTPPSGLTTQTPNANIYQQVYMVLKSMTDEMWKKYGSDEWNGVIGYLEGNKIVSGEYLSYLKKLLNKRN